MGHTDNISGFQVERAAHVSLIKFREDILDFVKDTANSGTQSENYTKITGKRRSGIPTFSDFLNYILSTNLLGKNCFFFLLYFPDFMILIL